MIEFRKFAKRPLISLILASAPQARAFDAITGIASVTDRDTLQIHGKRIRLYGIDSPESVQT
jgi:endonuclease YncB( thermonuclease family)